MLGPFNVGVDKRLELLNAVEYGLELHPAPFLPSCQNPVGFYLG